MPKKLKQDIRGQSRVFYRDFLQLDKNLSSTFSLSQDLDIQVEVKRKFGWRIMCLNMAQIMAVVEFFKRYAAQESAKGIQNLVDKIEYFNEEEQILTE